MNWLIPSWTFIADPWTLIFQGLIVGIGLCVLGYAAIYFHEPKSRQKFFPSILAFGLAMFGLVSTNDLIVLFICWELTSLLSFFLIAFDGEDPKARKSALHSALITGAGGLCLLMAIVLIEQSTGVTTLTGLLENPDLLAQNDLLPAIAILVLLASFSKSAIFPFHFWLPNAMTAPTPVSTYLHSATMVKAGVYLCYRLDPVLSSWPYWKPILFGFGLFTFLMMSLRSYFQKDLKGVVAYTTAGALGLMIGMIGSPIPQLGVVLGLFVLGHGLYKASLFFLVGHLDRQTENKKVGAHHGLRKVMPITFTISIGSFLAAAGLGPFLSFAAKEMYLASLSWPMALALGAGFIFSNAASLLITWKPFLGATVSHPNSKESIGLLLFPGLLLLAHVTLGLSLASWSLEFFGHDVHLWHGWNLALFFSILFFAGSFVVLRFVRSRELPFQREADIFDSLFHGHLKAAKFLMDHTQNGQLIFYILITCLFAVFGLLRYHPEGLPEISWILSTSSTGLSSVFWLESLLLLMVVAGTLMMLLHHKVLSLILSLGLIGVAVSLYFAYFGALDLAMTQLSVEALSVLLFAVVARKVPGFLESHQANFNWKFLRTLVAVAAGVMIFFVVYLSSLNLAPSRLRDYFATTSLPQGQGANVVNVILVDYRAFDTLGEITVLGTVAIAIYFILSSSNSGARK